MDKKLPIFDIVLNDDDLKQGVGMISLVDEPAIGVNWIKLSQNTPINFQADKEKQLLYGPFLIPNMLIYRSDEVNGEYYVRFSKEEIEKIATKFNEDLNNKNINFQHTETKVDAFVAQNWIIEGDQDKSKNFGFDLPEGTWFGSVKIKDEDFWNTKVKENEVKGFSVEILADLQLNLKNKEKLMEKQIKLGQATLENGTTVYWDGEFGMGTMIYIDEALTELAPDRVHVLEDGTRVTTLAGEVVEIEVPAVEEEAAKKKEKEKYEEEMPNGNSITAEEVSNMIDSRFAELMEEITRLKGMVEGQAEEFKKTIASSIKEAFSMTPAKPSINKGGNVDEKFKAAEDKIKMFLKNK